VAIYEFRDPDGQVDTKIYLGWSGLSYRTGLEIYYSNSLIAGLEPDDSSGLHLVDGAGIVKHLESLRDPLILKRSRGFTVHSDAIGEVSVRAARKLGIFEKLIVSVNGRDFRGREILKLS
jgi:hypothetical protein